MTTPRTDFRPGWKLCSLFFAVAFSVFGADSSKRTAKSSGIAEALFTGGQVLRIQIEVSEEGMATLRKSMWQFGQQPQRQTVKATVREAGRVYTNVAVHLKGAAGSFRPVDDNPGFTLNFQKFAEGQRFHGLKKLSLNNSVQDPTFVSEQLSREMFLKAGVPVPRATHASVQLNGRDLGLHVLTEGFDRQYLKRFFNDTSGNLYDGGFLKDVTQELAVNSGDDPKDQSDRLALAAAAQETNLTNRLARLQKVLDIDRFLTFMAVDIMIWDWDGYPMNRNNWRLYNDRDHGKMVFMPHGLDQLFWKPDGPILPPMQGLVARAVLQIPELRQRYFERTKELFGTAFDVPNMTNRVLQIAAKIRPVIAEKGPAAVKEHERAIADYCEAIARRGRSLEQQLAHPIVPLAFDSGGAASLGGWEPKSQFGRATLQKTLSPGSGNALNISATQGSSIGSWQTKVWLEPGRYRIEGKIKTDGIVADLGDPRGGAGFRTANSRPEKPIIGTSDWQPFAHEFAVEDPVAQVEVVCEFRGTTGQAFFDLDSLRLKKIGGKP